MFQRAEHALRLDGLEAARGFFAHYLDDSDPIESLWVAHVDDQARCLHVTHHEGDESGARFPIRTILADAVQHCSTGIILAHNHPSGDAMPSECDCRATRRLANAAEALDCIVLDHLVFAGGKCTSLRQMGLL